MSKGGSRRAFVGALGALWGAPLSAAVALNAQPPGDPRLTTHPQLARALELLNAKRWRELARLVRGHPPDSACVLLDDLGDQSAVDLDTEGLARETFGSTILGALYVNWGWRYRGSGWASSVTEEMGQAFDARLRTARERLDAAVAQDGDDGVAFNFLFRTLKGLSQVGALHTGWAAFERAARKPVRAFAQVADAMSPRWFGSEEYILAFARAQQRALEPASHGLIAQAANEHIFGRMRASGPQAAYAFAAQVGVLGEVGAANDAYMAGGSIEDVYQARYAHGHFSFFFSFLGLHDLARAHLNGLGDFVAAPWDTLDDPIASLEAARALAGIGAT